MDQKKSKEEKIIENIDRAINELVYEKTSIIKAYNYYHGKRDPEQFRHLEENYGIGTPTSVEFVPLVKKHIDVLIGEYISTPVMPKISCKDKSTITNIDDSKGSTINSKIAEILKSHLSKIVYEGSTDTPFKKIENEMNDIHNLIGKNFISDFEMAGQNIVDWSMQSRNIDFENKRKVILTDLLVSGTCYFKTCATLSNTNVMLKLLNPINTFIDRNPESPYLKNSARSVIRHYLTKQQILSTYGDFLKKEDLDTLETMEAYSADGSTTTYIRSYDSTTGNTISDGILGGFEVTPLLPFERNTSKFFRLYPVYEVEWLQADKVNGSYITNRYEGIRIGTNIYIPIGLSPHIIRSIDSPKDCSLSVNGIFYSDRNGDPFSLILSTANLQDKFDCLNFYRDNLIAESGSIGDWVDVAHLPKFLGADVTERIIKWKAYKKSGLALYDSSQEGDMLNTSFNGFDDTIKLDTIQAIDLAIQRVEETTSTITGVFRERLGGVEQKDAVSNVQTGVKQSSYITKQYYQLMDLMTREILIDILNICKIVYKNGISGTIVLGENLTKTFIALPEHYSFTDFDVHIVDSSEYKIEQETIKQLVVEFTKGGIADPEIILEMITAKGLTKMKSDVLEAMHKKKQENDKLGQLEQQAKQLESELQKSNSEAQKLQNEVKSLNEQKIALEREKLAFSKELEWYKARSLNSYNDSMLEFEKQRIQLEGAQLLDNSRKNDEVKNA